MTRLAVVIVATMAVMAACSVEENYPTLSFFFDGVPDPNAPADDGTAPGQLLSEAVAAARAASLARTVPVLDISHHRPVRDRRCHECHLIEDPRGRSGLNIGMPTLVAPIEELCLRCHDFSDRRYVHGPVANGLCVRCHLAHQSIHPHLLRTDDIPSLCSSCHIDELFVTKDLHATFGEERCTACHNPHASDHLMLLEEPVPADGGLPDRVEPRALEGGPDADTADG